MYNINRPLKARFSLTNRITSSEKPPFCRVLVPRIFGSTSFRYCISTYNGLLLSTAESSGAALGLFPSDSAVLQRISMILIFGTRLESYCARIFVCGFDPRGNTIILYFFILSCVSHAKINPSSCTVPSVLYPVSYS